MTDPLHLEPGTAPTAIIEAFNAFHDGFLRSIALASLDHFEQVGPEAWNVGHETTGEFVAVLEFAHYNYGGTIQPLDRIVRATFRGVHDFALDLAVIRPIEWPLKHVAIEASTRPTEAGDDAPCFALTLTWGRLDGLEWSTQSQQAFTFLDADFEEASG